MKYFNKKVTFQGITFDSTKERDRYLILKDKQRRGEISNLELQKYFELLPKQIRQETIQLKTKTKKVEKVDERAVGYHCDFYYFDCKKDVWVIEEVKSKATMMVRDYPLRRKLVKLMVEKMNDDAGKEMYVFNEIVK